MDRKELEKIFHNEEIKLKNQQAISTVKITVLYAILIATLIYMFLGLGEIRPFVDKFFGL
jgi:hypothetical protein